jgi:hypothetical protein
MSQPSPEAVILRQILDIKERYLGYAIEAGAIVIDRKDERELKRLERELAKVTNREE